MSSLDEQVAALLAGGGARGAATLVIRTEGPRVVGFLQAVLRDEDDAADAFSLWAEWLWTAMPRFRGASAVSTWSFGIARNAARRVQGEAWRRRRQRLETGEASRLADEIRTRSARRRERDADRLDALRRDLTLDEQELLVLRIDQKLEWEEIAAIVSADGAQLQPAALRKRFERLKEKIGRLARDRGLVEEPPRGRGG